MKVQVGEPVDKDARKLLYRQLASYFTMVLREYERAMDSEKEDTTASRNAYATMVQTRENLKPVRQTVIPGMLVLLISAAFPQIREG
jgi:pre-mRNA-splicing factor 18